MAGHHLLKRGQGGLISDQLSLAREMQTKLRRATIRAEQTSREDTIVVTTVVADELAHQISARKAWRRFRHAGSQLRRGADRTFPRPPAAERRCQRTSTQPRAGLSLL